MAEQAQRLERIESGLSLRVGARKRLGRDLHAWDFDWRQPATGSQTTRLVFLGWGEVIRSHWPKGLWSLAKSLPSTYTTIFLKVGPLRVLRMSQPVFLAGALPLIWLASLLALVAWLLSNWTILVAMPVSLATILVFLWAAQKLRVAWLLRTYAFITRLANGRVPETDQLMKAMVERFFQQLAPISERPGEVLIVAHSVGTMLAPLLVQRILNDTRWKVRDEPLYLLTLGQSIPLVTLVGGAEGYRQTIRAAATHPGLRWLDLSSRIDPLCFHRTSPLGEAMQLGDPLPSLAQRSVGFFRLYTRENWRLIKRDKLKTHFLYLMTGDKPGDFNLYSLILAPLPLQKHFVPKYV